MGGVPSSHILVWFGFMAYDLNSFAVVSRGSHDQMERTAFCVSLTSTKGVQGHFSTSRLQR